MLKITFLGFWAKGGVQNCVINLRKRVHIWKTYHKFVCPGMPLDWVRIIPCVLTEKQITAMVSTQLWYLVTGEILFGCPYNTTKWHSAIWLGISLGHRCHCCQGDLAPGQSMMGSHWLVWIATEWLSVCWNIALPWPQNKSKLVCPVEGGCWLSLAGTEFRKRKSITRHMVSHGIRGEKCPFAPFYLVDQLNVSLQMVWWTEDINFSK